MDTEQPDTPTALPAPTTAATLPQRHFLIAFFFSFMWGMVGADRFYLGKIGTGILKLVTLGGLGIWVIVDLALIMSGGMRDKNDQPLLETARYKKFAGRTVLWFAIIVGVVVLANGVAAIIILQSLVNGLMSGGGLQQFVPGGGATSGINQLLHL